MAFVQVNFRVKADVIDIYYITRSLCFQRYSDEAKRMNVCDDLSGSLRVLGWIHLTAMTGAAGTRLQSSPPEADCRERRTRRCSIIFHL